MACPMETTKSTQWSLRMGASSRYGTGKPMVLFWFRRPHHQNLRLGGGNTQINPHEVYLDSSWSRGFSSPFRTCFPVGKTTWSNVGIWNRIKLFDNIMDI